MISAEMKYLAKLIEISPKRDVLFSEPKLSCVFRGKTPPMFAMHFFDIFLVKGEKVPKKKV